MFEFLSPAKQVGLWDADVIESQFGRVRCPAAQFVELAYQLEPVYSARHDEQRLAAVSQLFVDDGVDDVDIGDAEVADPHLVTVDHPVVAVTPGCGSQISYVAAAFGLGDRQRRELEIPRRSEALRRPLEHLLR